MASPDSTNKVAETTPEYTGDKLFSPFSLLTSDMTDFDKADSAYIALRDLVMHTVFPETIDSNDTELLIGRRKLAGNAIRPLLNLALAKNTRHPWYDAAIMHTTKLGIDITPGHGVTFARPEEFMQRDIVGNNASRTSKPGITPTLLAFVQIHTA